MRDSFRGNYPEAEDGGTARKAVACREPRSATGGAVSSHLYWHPNAYEGMVLYRYSALYSPSPQRINCLVLAGTG
jgi:hypothetical protein